MSAFYSKKILNDPVGSNDCDHLFCRGCLEQLVSGKGQCPKCESGTVDTGLKDITDKVLSVSNTVNNFIRDFSLENSLDVGQYLKQFLFLSRFLTECFVFSCIQVITWGCARTQNHHQTLQSVPNQKPKSPNGFQIK